ncbi:hypothetical protein NFI96_017009 [Prochilodus magdalenae]|nr:hypothetical protein NFI96_017009 [Prochilodus magdalenae]
MAFKPPKDHHYPPKTSISESSVSESASLRVVLFGNTSAVSFGDENILLGEEHVHPQQAKLPRRTEVSGRVVSVINLLDLHEGDMFLDPMEDIIGQLLGENSIHSFIFVLQLGHFTDADKVGLEWLQRKFGEGVLQFVMILFTYEREEDCDTIIDDLKKNPVLEQLLQKCGSRYHTCSKNMSSQSEMRKLLELIDHMITENNHRCYTAELYNPASDRKDLQDNKDKWGAYDCFLQQHDMDKMSHVQIEKKEKGKNTGLGAAHDPLHHLGGKINDINNLLLSLQLTTNKEQKLKPADALQILAQSLSCKETCTEQKLVQTFLQRLLLGDYRARYISVPEADSKLYHEEEDDAPSFEEFISKKSASPDGESSKDPVHPMDVQMAVFHCSDHFLKQLIVTKLSQCQYALPLLVPNPFTGEIEFPLWTFRQIKKSWKSIDTNDMKTIIRPICEVETPMVFFFRTGHISSSKSHLMSRLINEKHNAFFHRNCPGSTTDRLLMDGVVEIAWYFPSGKSTDRITDCVAFCNLHGDAENHKKQLEILTEMSSVNVVVVGDTTNAGILQKLYGGQKPLICLLCDDDSGARGTKRLKYKIGLKERNQAAVSEDLWKTIKECLSKSQNIAQPTFRLVNLCEKSGITTDENNPECRKGKEATLEIIQLLKAKELPCIKKTYLPCQGELWHEWSTKNKELYRLHGTNIEMQSIEIKDNMKQIRTQQSEHGLTKLMELFIQTVKSEHCFSPIEKSYFLKWLEIMLDDFTADDLSVLHHECDKKWSKVLDLKKQHNESKQLKDDSHAELEMISEKLRETVEVKDLDCRLAISVPGSFSYVAMML